MSSHGIPIPGTPRVTSPSPTPDGGSTAGSYFAPTTRSAAKRSNTTSTGAIKKEQDSDSDLEQRARSRSRSPGFALRQRRASGLAQLTTKPTAPVHKSEPLVAQVAQNGHLSPPSVGTSYWRELSRSPSPLGLIPIHQHWRSFIHRHEIPRKALHVSIGFLTLYFYARGVQPDDLHQWMLTGLVPIVAIDVLRHRVPEFNRIYVRVLGALMRESEVHDKYNGVIWYLLGAWIAMRWFPKDVAAMSLLLLSWCDTAASTFGRLYGRYTPRVRKGKSLAGSLAAVLVGAGTTALFYGVLVPRFWGYEDSFMYRGSLHLPEALAQPLALSRQAVSLSGWAALSVMSICSGLIASASEMVDIFGIDDNLTIPVLSGLGLWGFLKVFG